MFSLTQKEFIKLAKQGNLIPVYKEITADMETPVSAFKKIEGEYSFLLESVAGGEKIARYSFLGAGTKNDLQTIASLSDIKNKLAGYKTVAVTGLPRFHGGLVGYIGYDAVRQVEDIPDKNPDQFHLPQMLFLWTETLLAFDHLKHKIIIISNVQVKGDAARAYKDACRKIKALEKKLQQPLQLSPQEWKLPDHSRKKLKFSANMSQREFAASVKAAKDYIRAGDIIQVVLSQRLSAPCSADPFNVYRILRAINPSPYMYYLKFGQIKLAGASPEVMVRLENRQATLRPIAGTRPRGSDEASDQRLASELLASEKERAEHIMLVDLGRNDLGRVCDFGTVKVTEQMTIERYSHVMHLVSNVTGKLKKGLDAIALLSATFPAGTVSGAPKVRAMEIIDELENVKRGPYAGCVGYFGLAGEMDTCITIRTIIFKGKQAYVQAGAGIVADSLPTQEYQETLNKAQAMLRAIELAS
ncbi:anthranilate synthase component I [Candidatus Saganbacteria bacterium]|nr:anthranilate synthase component I [Candidatus Saganbacteria bacterium]